MISRREALLLLGAMSSVPFAGTVAQTAGGDKPAGLKAVVELYTSQGCSSCPPADALLRKLAGRRDIIALTLPVDYWDYLGWKDTFASARYSERQRAYAKNRGDGLIYTPQVVVNGLAHVNGAKDSDIERAIEKTTAQFKASEISLKVWADRGQLVIETGTRANGLPAEATIWLATVQTSAEIAVRKGENSGRTLTYANVVRELTPIGMWNGKAETIRLERQSVMRAGAETCAVLIQQGTAGPILGAAWLGQ